MNLSAGLLLKLLLLFPMLPALGVLLFDIGVMFGERVLYEPCLNKFDCDLLPTAPGAVGIGTVAVCIGPALLEYLLDMIKGLTKLCVFGGEVPIKLEAEWFVGCPAVFDF